MTDKKKLQKFRVKFLVKAIIGIDVEANNYEEAIEKARTVIAKGVYKAGLETIDGHEYVAGFDNENMWDESQ